MPLIGFKEQFADDVESGKKRQTIRALRKRLFRSGDRLYLYTGLRTPRARSLGIWTCKEAKSVRLFAKGLTLLDISIDGALPLSTDEAEAFARADGFGGDDPVFALRQFFELTHGLPFHGQLIKW